jgi:hypothetical protein
MEKTKEMELNARPIPIEQRWLPQHKLPNTACTPAAYAGAEPAQSPAKGAGATLAPPASAGVVVGLPLRGVRVFRQFAWLKTGSGKAAFPRPTPSG